MGYKKYSLFSSLCSKLGFHKNFYLEKQFFNKPIFKFHGEVEIRGYPGNPIESYIKGLSLQKINFKENSIFLQRRFIIIIFLFRNIKKYFEIIMIFLLYYIIKDIQ